MKRQLSIQRLLLTGVIGFFVLTLGSSINADSLQEARKKYKKAFPDGSVRAKKGAIRSLGSTNKPQAYNIIAKKTLELSKKIWENQILTSLAQKKRDYGKEPGSKEKEAEEKKRNKLNEWKQVQEAGIEELKKIKTKKIFRAIVGNTAMGGGGGNVEIEKRYLARKGNFAKRLAEFDTGKDASILLQLVDSVEEEYRILDKKMEDKSGVSPLNEDRHRMETEVTELLALRKQLNDALIQLSSKEALDTMVSDGLNHGSQFRREAVGRAIREMEDDTTRKAVIERLKKGDRNGYRLNKYLVQAARKRRIHDAEPQVRKRLADSSELVQREAAKAMEVIGVRDSVPALIEALKGARGITADAIASALSVLTPMDYGTSYQQWKDWWEENKNNPDVGETARRQHHKKKQEERGSEEGEHMTKVDFFEHEIKTHKLAFILDRSGSMQQPAEVVEEEEEEEEGPETPDRGAEEDKNKKEEPPWDKPTGQPTRLEVAQYELKKVIFYLTDKHFFNIIFYNSSPQIWKKGGLMKATERRKKQAYKFIDKQNPSGATNVYDSIEMAFGLGDPNKKTDVDTIFLLSDGIPNRGQYTDPGAIVKQVKKKNQGRNVKINTIILGNGSGAPSGQAANADFLKKLAKETGGQFEDPATR